MCKRWCLFLSVGISLVFVWVVAGCKSTGKSSDNDTAETASATVASVSRGSIRRTLNLAGQFQPYQVIDVHAKVSGYIRKIYVDIGDRVQAGQTLADRKSVV